MPRDKGYTLDTFFISSEFLELSVDRLNSERGAPAAQYMSIGRHSIKIENLTTLPYDVEVTSKSSDTGDGYGFHIDGEMQQGWTASFKSILSNSDERSCALIQRHGSNRIARIQTTKVKYKRPIWQGWDEHEIHPVLEIAIECK